MGYRDLESFSLALITKQGWWILKHLDSLMSRVLKQKYFPNDTFLSSQLGRNPSYAWHSIWNAKHLLHTSLIWRVGNGELIKIWGDRWIPYPSTYTIQSPPRILDKESKVSALIDEDTKWWNSLVSNIFNAKEATLIYNILISPVWTHDTLVWLGTENGDFSVKIAYHMAKVNIKSSNGSNSNLGSSKQFWRKIWNIRSPPC
jgi:hypothetical protein